MGAVVGESAFGADTTVPDTEAQDADLISQLAPDPSHVFTNRSDDGGNDLRTKRLNCSSKAIFAGTTGTGGHAA